MTRDWVHGMGHSPVCQILLQILCKALITESPPACTSSPGKLSIPGDFPSLSDFTAASTSSLKIDYFAVSVTSVTYGHLQLCGCTVLQSIVFTSL